MLQNSGVAAARIFKNEWFTKFARKEGISDAALVDVVRRAERGLVDADLGGGLIKQRVARKGQGKSGGYRTLIAARLGDRAVFLFGFAKSSQDNLTVDELKVYHTLAKAMLALTEEMVAALVEKNVFVEVDTDDQRKNI